MLSLTWCCISFIFLVLFLVKWLSNFFFIKPIFIVFYDSNFLSSFIDAPDLAATTKLLLSLPADTFFFIIGDPKVLLRFRAELGSIFSILTTFSWVSISYSGLDYRFFIMPTVFTSPCIKFLELPPDLCLITPRGSCVILSLISNLFEVIEF